MPEDHESVPIEVRINEVFTTMFDGSTMPEGSHKVFDNLDASFTMYCSPDNDVTTPIDILGLMSMSCGCKLGYGAKTDPEGPKHTGARLVVNDVLPAVSEFRIGYIITDIEDDAPEYKANITIPVFGVIDKCSPSAISSQRPCCLNEWWVGWCRVLLRVITRYKKVRYD